MISQHAVEDEPAASCRDPWREALDAVERDVAGAEELLRRLHEGLDVPEATVSQQWTPPHLDGPLPSELLDRALALLRRQREVGVRLAEAMVQSRSERRVLTKLEPAERPPVFVDRAL